MNRQVSANRCTELYRTPNFQRMSRGLGNPAGTARPDTDLLSSRRPRGMTSQPYPAARVEAMRRLEERTRDSFEVAVRKDCQRRT